MATDGDFWDRFRRWRRTRPFWGGLFLVVASILFFLSSNLHPFGNIQINLGPAGFLSYVIPVVVLLCGLLGWFTPAQRIFYGVIALVTSLYSLIGLNFGGFGVSMFVGFAGGAMLIAWGPPRIRPGAATPPPPTGHSGDDAVSEPSSPSTSAPTETIDTAGHDDRATEDVRPAFIPGMEPEPGEPPRRVFRGKALVVGLAGVGLVASFLVAGGSMPARAEVECPEGLPSRSTSPSASASVSSAPSSAAAPSGSAAPSASLVLPVIGHSSAPASGPAPGGSSAGLSASPSPGSSSAGDDDGHPVVDGVKGVVDGVGDLLGIKGGKSTSPAPSASPTPPAGRSTPSGGSSGSGTGSSGTGSSGSGTGSSGSGTGSDGSGSSGSGSSGASAEPTKTAEPNGEPSNTASPADSESAPAAHQGSAAASAPEPDPSGSELPCLGARIFGKVSDGDGIGPNAVKPGLLQDTKLTLIDATYEGVATIPTGDGGTMRALQFNMSRAINDGFRLTIDEPGGNQTLFKADQLITDQNVRFYTPRFEGKFAGLIPMTFTPEQPPPLMLSKMVFTDVSIDLAHVRCDTLTSTPLSITSTD